MGLTRQVNTGDAVDLQDAIPLHQSQALATAAQAAAQAASVPLAGHGAESVIGNPTSASANAADISVNTDSVVGRSGSGHVGNIPMTAAGRAMAGAASATAQTALLDTVTSATKGLAPPSGGGTTNFFRSDLTWATPPSGVGTITALTGDVAASGTGSVTATIQAGAVTNAKRANMAAGTMSGNATGSPAAPTDLTAAAIKTLLAISFADVSGVVQAAQFPALTGDVTTVAGALATTIANLPQAPLVTRLAALTTDLAINSHKITGAANPTSPQDLATKSYVDSATGASGTIVSLNGDVVASGSGAVAATIQPGVVSFTKQQNIPSQSLVGRQTAGTGSPESLTVAGGVEFTTGGIQRSALTGNVTAPAGSNATTIAVVPFTPLQTSLAGATGAVSFNGQALTSIADPTTAQGAATKAYVDALVSGLKWKQSVVAASTTNIILSTGAQNGSVIDDITLTTGDRINLRVQTAGSENGIYTVNATGAPTRSLDADTGIELVSCAFFVQKGTINADKAFVCTNDAITIGSTSIAFVPFASVVGALIAANNLSDLTSASTARTNLGLAAIAASGSASDLVSGTVPAAQSPALTGDVTKVAGSNPTVVTNIPTHVTVAGDLLFTEVGAPATPTGLRLEVWADIGDEVLKAKNPGGEVSRMSLVQAAVAHQFLTGNNADGTSPTAAPAFTDLTGNMTGTGQLPTVVGFTTLANTSGSSTTPHAANVAEMRTMLGLDSPQGMDLFLSFGNGIGTSGDCQMPASAGVGGWPVFLLQKSLNGDYTVNGYLGGSADANLNVAEVINQFPVIGTFTQCELRIFTVALTLGSNTSIECLVSKNSFINSTPCSVSVTTVGFQSSGAVAMSFSTGDEIGVRVRATGGGGAGSPTFAKYMVHVHLTP